jgi:hypothetical protein
MLKRSSGTVGFVAVPFDRLSGALVVAAAEKADIANAELIRAADHLGVRTQRGRWWLSKENHYDMPTRLPKRSRLKYAGSGRSTVDGSRPFLAASRIETGSNTGALLNDSGGAVISGPRKEK